MKRPHLLIRILATLAVALLSLAATYAHDEGTQTYIPIGGFYGETFPGFLTEAIHRAEELETDRVYILMMPMSFTYDVTTLTQADLIVNTQDSERRRRQLEDACSEMTDLYCEVVVPPVYTREAAEQEALLDYFADDLAAVYFLGGDQVYAMEITANTPLETALAEAFESGVPMGGNSAGLAVGSRAMIAGYGGDEFGPENGFNEGAVLLWNGEEERGLSFGSQATVLEQHFWERARLSRFLNALPLDGAPGVGIGVDSFTGGLLTNDETFSGLFGLYSAAVLDVETLGARATAAFAPVGEGSAVLSVRDVLLHTIAPGDFSYDISARAHSLAAPLAESAPASPITGPEGAGRLMLAGSAASFPANFMVADATGYVLLAGYADAAAAAEATGFTDGEGAFFIGADTALPAELATAKSLALIVGDLTQIDPAQFAPLRDAWLAGADLALGGDAAALAGAFYAAMPPTPYDSDDDLLIEAATQGTLLEGGTTVAEGWGLIPAVIEARVMDDNRYGRWIATAYQHPELPALALSDEATLAITAEGAFVGGSNAVVHLDLSRATLALGENGALVFANGVLDVFAPGDTVE